MEYTKLGNTGMDVSRICLGCMGFGDAERWTHKWVLSEADSRPVIKKAVELGINFFDTANVYARGESEKVVGAALKDFQRDSYVLATKVFFPMGDGPNDRGLSRKHIMEQAHLSLKRLGTDYIDLYQCHRYDDSVPLEETLRALDDLVSQGKVLYVGVSQWSAANIRDALDLADKLNLDRIVSNQPYYNALGRDLEKEVMPLCEQEGIGQVVYSPLAQGVLSGKYKPGQPLPEGSRAADPEQNMFLNGGKLDEKVLEGVQKLLPLAEREGLTMSQFALAWCLRKPNVSSVIIGASRPQQVDDNAGAAGKTLSDETLREIDAALGF
jgi:aryl-alcohol dehydrogenase-like predicted oxidoreductase